MFLTASATATAWGVVTTIAPSIGTASFKAMRISPVPGGASITRKSSSGHAAFFNKSAISWGINGPFHSKA